MRKLRLDSKFIPNTVLTLKRRQFSVTNKKMNFYMNWRPTRSTKEVHYGALEISESKMQTQIAFCRSSRRICRGAGCLT